MEAVNVTRVKAQFSRVLRRVARGETVLISRRGRVIARIVPAGPGTGGPVDAALEALEREGALRRAVRPPDAGVLDGGMPEAPPGRGLLRALLGERDEGP